MDRREFLGACVLVAASCKWLVPSGRTEWKSNVVKCPPVLLTPESDFDVLDRCLERARNTLGVQANEEMLCIGGRHFAFADDFVFYVSQPSVSDERIAMKAGNRCLIADQKIRRNSAIEMANRLLKKNGRIAEPVADSDGFLQGCLEFECRWTMPAGVKAVAHV